MNQKKNYLRISDLSREAGISNTRIRYYIDREIVPKPIKANRTMAYYTEKHLERLRIVKELHDEKGLSTSMIKTIIESVAVIEGGRESVQSSASEILRNEVIYASIPVFRKKGYEKTTTTDIAKAAGISRYTFYKNFKDKKELFIICINKIFLDWRREVVESDDILLVWRKMALAFHRAWPEWSDMMNLLRAAAVKYPDEFADRLQEALTTRIKPIINDVKKATRSGSIRDVDPEITGIMLAAIADYISYYIYRGRFKDKKLSEVFDVVLDIFFHGLASS